jgi:prevent-host-death family protein
MTLMRSTKFPTPLDRAKKVSIADAKARFAEYVREAEQGGSVVITRHGKPVAALVTPKDWEQVQRLRAAGPKQGLASLLGGWEGSDEFVEAVYRANPRLLNPRDLKPQRRGSKSRKKDKKE